MLSLGAQLLSGRVLDSIVGILTFISMINTTSERLFQFIGILVFMSN